MDAGACPGGTALFGDSIAIGDLNADGRNDIIIGSTFADDPGRQMASVGAVYVIFGSADLPPTINTALGEQDAAIYAADPFDGSANLTGGGAFGRALEHEMLDEVGNAGHLVWFISGAGADKETKGDRARVGHRGGDHP